MAAQADPAALGIAGVRLALGEARTTVLSGVPGLVPALLEGRADAWGATRLRAVRLHGERPFWADVDAVRAGAPGAAVQIGYSSTEVQGAQWFVPPGARRTASHPPAGRMLPGVRWRLVDPRGRDASAGELVVAGPAAAIGEWREGRLVPAPEQRTGDLVGVDADGLVEVLGRLDRQIRIAGRRVEPAEIEAALRRAAGVADAVVLPDASRGATEVVAYVAADASREVAVRASLREALDSGLPRSWHPQRIHVAVVLPRLLGGKLDVPALRALDEAATRASGAAATPRDAASAAVDRAWRAVLRRPPPSDGSSWTGSGGDSLSMLRFVFEAERALGARIPVAALSMDMGPGEVAATLRRREPRRDGPPGCPPVALLPGITGDSPSLAAFRAEVSEGLWLVPVEYPSWRTMAAAGGGSVAMMADAAAAALAAVPGGPVGLMGYSIGGAVAAELSLRPSREGHAPAWSIVLDSDVGPGPGRRRRSTARILAARDRDPLVVLAVRTAARWLSHPSACRTFAALARPGAVAALPGALPFVVDREMTEALQKWAFRRWVAEGPRPLPTGPIWVMRSAESRDRQAGDLGWSRHGDVAAVVDVEGCHLTMLTRPARATLVRLVLDAAAILESSRTRCASQPGTGCYAPPRKGRAAMTDIATRDQQTLEHLAADGPYVIRHGDVWLTEGMGGNHVADGSGQMAVAFDDDGVLMKHGEASRVSAYAEKAEKALSHAMGDDAPRITVLSFPVTPETIAELNACTAASGRVMTLERRLAAMGGVGGPGAAVEASTAPPAEAPTPTASPAERFWVTRDELRGALDMEPLRQDRGVSTDGEAVLALRHLAPAVRQPEYAEGEPDGKGRARLVPTGRVLEGVEGLRALEAGFGPGAKRSLHVDGAAAGEVDVGRDRLDRLRAISAARSPGAGPDVGRPPAEAAPAPRCNRSFAR